MLFCTLFTVHKPHSKGLRRSDRTCDQAQKRRPRRRGAQASRALQPAPDGVRVLPGIHDCAAVHWSRVVAGQREDTACYQGILYVYYLCAWFWEVSLFCGGCASWFHAHATYHISLSLTHLPTHALTHSLTHSLTHTYHFRLIGLNKKVSLKYLDAIYESH